jgi:hypothetical protein
LIRFLKINDIYRLLVLAIFFSLARLLIFFTGDHPLTQLEKRYFITAKAVAQGKLLYKDVWETCEPLSVLLTFLMPNDISLFTIFSFWINVILVVTNAVLLNGILQKNDVMSDKTHFPAFFSLLFTLTFRELNVLSPALTASFFLLLVLNSFLAYLKKEETTKMYQSGFYLGIATLFYLPTILFFLFLLASITLFTRSTGKAYLSLLLGLVFPWLCLSVFFYWLDGSDEMWHILSKKYFSLSYSYLSWKESIYTLSIPLVVFLVGVFYSLNTAKSEINYQSVCRRFLILWFFAGISVFCISPIKSNVDFHILIPSLAFLCTYFYLEIRKMAIPNMALLLSPILLVTLQVLTQKNRFVSDGQEQSFVNMSALPKLESEKKVWVTGSNTDLYLNVQPATKYLNWQLSQDDFGRLDRFEALENVRISIQSDMPDIIVDQTNIIPTIFAKLPLFSHYYQQEINGIYKKK